VSAAKVTFLVRAVVAVSFVLLAWRVWRARTANGPVLYAFGQREGLIALTMAWYLVAGLVDRYGSTEAADLIRAWAFLIWTPLLVGMIRLWRALGRYR
jgi:hypothetical protein